MSPDTEASRQAGARVRAGMSPGSRGAGTGPPPPPPTPTKPAAAPRAPTSPVAEAVPHGHALRTPIATAPVWAKSGLSLSTGLRTRTLMPTALLAPGPSEPDSDSPSVSLQRALDLLQNPCRAEAGSGGLVRSVEVGLSPTSIDPVNQPSLFRKPARVSTLAFQVPPTPPRASLLPAPQLLPRLTLVIEQSVLHHKA